MGQPSYYSRGPYGQEMGRATIYILTATIFVFLVQLIFPSLSSDWLSLIPSRVIFRFELWRLFTYLFMHANFTHIFFNMLGLFFFGPVLERTMGYRRFLNLYFLCGCGGGAVAVAFYFLLGEPAARVIGASGAIFGIVTAYGVLFPENKILLYFVLPIKAKWMVIIYGALEFFATIQYAAGARSGIASIAHLSGIVIAYFYIRRGSGLRKLWWRYKYWQALRERDKRFKVYPGGQNHTLH
jgi:membrane associated rhomboid family serine protease